MKVLILTSNSPRHDYFIHKISQSFNKSCVIIQKKTNYYETQKNNSNIIRNHFRLMQFHEENSNNKILNDVLSLER